MRMFGLEALAALLRTVAPEGRVAMSIGAPSVVQVESWILATGLGCPLTKVQLGRSTLLYVHCDREAGLFLAWFWRQ